MSNPTSSRRISPTAPSRGTRPGTAAACYASGPATLTNTIVAGNTNGGGAASDIVGTVAGSSSHNLIGIGGSGGLSNGSGGNIVLTSLTNLGLAPLGYYGGPMETMALLPGSPAIGAGTSSSSLPTTDERGFALDSPGPDIGAFQTQTTSVPLVVNSTGDGPGQPGQLDLRVAVDLADIAGTSQTITFDPTVFATPQTIVLTQGPIVLNNTLAPVTIEAPAAGVTVSGGNQGTVFVVGGGATASISGLTITGGSAIVRRRPVQFQGGDAHAHRLHHLRQLRRPGRAACRTSAR